MPWRVDAPTVTRAFGMARVRAAQRSAGDRPRGAGAAGRGDSRAAVGRGDARRQHRADRRRHRAWRGAAALRQRPLHPVAVGGRACRLGRAHRARHRAARAISRPATAAPKSSTSYRAAGCSTSIASRTQHPCAAGVDLRRPRKRRQRSPRRPSNAVAPAASRRSICSSRLTAPKPGNLALRGGVDRRAVRRRRHRAEDPAGAHRPVASCAAFRDKGPLASSSTTCRCKVILNPRAGLLGAAVFASV